MSNQQSRAARRQAQRGGGARPPRRDPMVGVYIGIGVVIVLIFAALAVYRVHQNAQIAAATATPTPGPNASEKPLQLTEPGLVGASVLPSGNATAGGHGAPVDGIQCSSQEQVTMHIHSHLALFVKGKQIAVPEYIGMVPAPGGTQVLCLYWLHTHDASGIIHVEAPDFLSPDGGPYTLGMFFDVWGEPLSSAQVATFKGPVTAYVNGAEYDGDPRAIPLLAHQQITIEVGKPLVPPPNYSFPIGV